MATATRSAAHFLFERSATSAHAALPEYLETDGLGGYALGSATGEAFRRYHGLLVAARADTAKRLHCLARFDERVHVGAESFALAPGRFAGGETLADAFESFELAPHPCAHYRRAGEHVEREVQLMRGHPCVLVRYSNHGQRPIELELRPLFTFRDEDALTVENDALDPRIEMLADGFRFQPYSALPAAFVSFGAAVDVVVDPAWYKGVYYAGDVERGYDGVEDQFSPCRARVTVNAGAAFIVAVALETKPQDLSALWRGEVDQRARPRTPVERLSVKARDFLYTDASGRSGVLAGFPWFVEWGRDTFIALPGLTLARGEIEACRKVLQGATAYLVDGLLPNIFGVDVATSHYGSADAALWFSRAVLLLDRIPEQREFVQQHLREPLESIVAAYERGTELGLRVDAAGLLAAGAPDRNPTWMDAQSSRGPVTPRDGYAIELNALWYQLIVFVIELRKERGLDCAHYESLRKRCETAFIDRFWLPESRSLADVWKAGAPDPSLRPNMVLAAACEHSPLSQAQRRDVVRHARRELVTACGLRTLARDHSEYCGRYEGGPDERDEAYHQGTVWPWLIGSYVEACLRAGYVGQKAELAQLVHGILAQLDSAGIDHISEVFDGDEPQRPAGTVAQAWNTGELLRALTLLGEDVTCAF